VSVFRLLYFSFLLLPFVSSAQRVGVVLSGGGSSGLAHVGVLKALEEAHIPIDYIAGTSMGALVGGMYAMGYTPAEIEKLVKSEEFESWVFGKQVDRYVYFYREREPDANWVGIKFRIDSVIQTRFPTNIISPANMDFAFLERTSSISAASGYNFDSLFVPFRCVAADIYNKAEVVFKEGDVGQAMRASSTYPFFYKPIVVDDKLLFDGGLYNNFPADVMYRDFLPDVIIGSTVVSEIKPPQEEDILSQIKNMLMERTSYSEVCETENMLIVRPQIPKVGILDFDETEAMIEGGYQSTLARLPQIQSMVSRRQDVSLLKEKRKHFSEKQKQVKIDDILIDGLSKNQSSFIKRSFRQKEFPVNIEDIRPYFYRVAYDERIRKIYPTARIDQESGLYKLNLQMKIDKDLQAQFGGVISSKPINTGFVALHLKRINRIGLALDFNSYFGKFYSSLQVKSTLDYPFKLPFQIETDFTLNNFDYFFSASSFFEDVKPSYLIQYDRTINTAIVFPWKNKTRIKTGLTAVRMYDDYYQTQAFTTADTADRTNFNHGSFWTSIERNTLNRKIYATTGSQFMVKFRYLAGQEFNDPGSTSLLSNDYRKVHDFWRMRLNYDVYFNKRGRVHAGFYGEAVISNQPLFNNYTASVLQAASFTPVPESKTLFQTQFRAHNYAAAGLKTILSFTSRLDLRVEGYVFQPHKQILQNEDLTASYGEPFAKRYFMASAVMVYHTPIAPIAVSVNYYDQSKQQFSVIFTTGFLIFNRKAFD
jgi:NTE family protein